MAGKSVLGRGVGALLPDDLENDGEEKFFMCDIDRIEPNPQQPRSYFDQEKLQELSESIRQRGIIQPLLVTSSKSTPKAQNPGACLTPITATWKAAGTTTNQMAITTTALKNW